MILLVLPAKPLRVIRLLSAFTVVVFIVLAFMALLEENWWEAVTQCGFALMSFAALRFFTIHCVSPEEL